ncbi:MAG: hypothetical protein BMS9Abin37_2462 [Acidobacteriota bacterium]|nr:MAG: hypothetical protein BMS9Abin37_2462 [Acidobacteriota bacterium]
MTVFWRYWLLQIPGWVVLAGLLAAAHVWLGLSPLGAVIVFAFWLAKDAVLYPILRPHYVFRERDARQNLLGQYAVAQETLRPRGYVKLRGELWVAELAVNEAPVPAGESVIVESVEGLTLKVRPRVEPRVRR